MTLRRQLLAASATVAAVAAVLGTVAIEALRSSDRLTALHRAAEAAIVDHQKEACEANPNWFLAGPREGRPTREELAQPDSDVFTKRPDAKPRPFEYFAFDEEFRGTTTAAPRFPDTLRAELKSGSQWAGENWKGPDGTGVEVALLTGWRNSECAVLLFRAAPPPHQWGTRVGIGALMFVALFAAAFGIATPIERRIAGVAAAMRDSAREAYTGLAPADGHDEITAVGAQFNATAADIRQRTAEIKEQADALRRLTIDTDADVVTPLAAVPARLGDVLRSVSLTTVVREQMQAAARDAHTVALHGANLVAASRLRDRDTPLDQSPVDLTSLVERAVARAEPFAVACGVRLSAAIPNRPVTIAADAPMLELALVNLIDNGVRYNKPGGVVSVDLDVNAGGGFILLVSDDGAGLNDASLKYFNAIRRFRGDERRRHREDEVGLGLAIVHEVTGRAKIGLAFKRTDQGGTTVTLDQGAHRRADG